MAYITNAGFETGSLSGWTSSGGWAIASAAPYNGTYYAHITSGAFNGADLTIHIQTAAGADIVTYNQGYTDITTWTLHTFDHSSLSSYVNQSIRIKVYYTYVNFDPETGTTTETLTSSNFTYISGGISYYFKNKATAGGGNYADVDFFTTGIQATWEVGSGKEYATIQSACDGAYEAFGSSALTQTATVDVYDGTYSEMVTPNTALNPTATYRLIIQAATGNYPVIDGGSVRNYCIDINAIDYVTISGFELKNAASIGLYLRNNSTYGILYNLYVHDCSTSSGITIYNGCTNTLAYNNLCINNARGINNDTNDGVKIYNNSLFSNTYNIIVQSSTNCLVKNNMVWADFNGPDYCISVGGTITGFVSDYNNFHVTNSAVVGRYGGADRNTLSDWQTASSQDANSDSADPIWFNAGGTLTTDYRIAESSPCRNSGVDLSGTFTTDYFGTTRPSGAAWDIGFHEKIVVSTGYEVGPGKDFATIQDALDEMYTNLGTSAFTSTQIVNVYDDTYTEQATPNTGLNPTATYRLIIQAAPSNNPVIDGEGTRSYGIYIDTIDYVTVSGFTIHDTTSYGMYFKTSTYGIVFNCILYDGGLWFDTNANYPTIYNNILHDIGTTGLNVEDCLSPTIYGNVVYSSGNIGIMVINGDNCLVRNNVCYSNTDSGIRFYSTDGGVVYSNFCYSNTNHGIAFGACTNSTIYNNLCVLNQYGISLITVSTVSKIYANTCYGNSGYGLYITGTSTGNTMKNNLIWSTAGKCIYVETGSTPATSDYNDIYPTGTAIAGKWTATDCNTLADWQTASSQDANSISSNPTFSNAGGTIATDYQIAAGSSCRNKGEDLTATFTTDYFGSTRPTGPNTWDVGFYELITRVGCIAGVTYGTMAKVAGVVKGSIAKILGIE